MDYQGNVWLAGSDDTFVQKYSHDGGKLLLQIETKDVADSSDGTIKGMALNSSHSGFYRPSSIAVDTAKDLFRGQVSRGWERPIAISVFPQQTGQIAGIRSSRDADA